MPNFEKQMPAIKPTVRIDTKQAIYRMFRHFNYKAWTALGEFVDNSVSSYIKNRDKLRNLEGQKYKLVIRINHDNLADTLTICDNAAGIALNDYDRAFALAEPPEDLRYINQYGVGMKIAGCWFAKKWTVISKALGEDVERTVVFDTDNVANNELATLPLATRNAKQDTHYTKIILSDLINPPLGRTKESIKSYLAKIYREFIKKGEIEIYWQDELLEVEEYKALNVPFYKSPSDPPREWKHDFKLQMESGQIINGTAVILNKFTRSDTGLNLFWHNRLIKGNFDPNYRPAKIFGGLQTHQSGRLCIDLHLDEFKPTVDKQNFTLEDSGASEDEIIDKLLVALKSAEALIYQQVTNYRLPKIDEMKPAIESEFADLDQFENSANTLFQNPSNYLPDTPYPVVESNPQNLVQGNMNVNIDGRPWKIKISLGDLPTDNQFVEIHQTPLINDDDAPDEISIKIGYSHPFIRNHLCEETTSVIVRMAAALAFGELAAHQAGAEHPSYVRANFNKFLNNVASIKE